MSRKVTTETDRTTLKSSDFKLEVPKELSVSPKWVIPLPGKREVRIFEANIVVVDYDDYDDYDSRKRPQKKVPGLHAVVYGADGFPSDKYVGSQSPTAIFENDNLVGLNLWLAKITKAVAPKKREVSRVEEED